MSEIEQIPAADWVDQDLLTRDDSSELLRREIEAEQSRLDELSSATDESTPQEREAIADTIRRRITAMEGVRRRIAEHKTPPVR